MLIHGSRIHAEDHLPCPVLVMHGGVIIHGVAEIRFVGGHAVDEAYERAILNGSGEAGVIVAFGVDQQPEMVGVRGDASGEAFVARRLRRREARSFDRHNRVKVIHGCMSNEHVPTLSRGVPNLHIRSSAYSRNACCAIL